MPLPICEGPCMEDHRVPICHDGSQVLRDPSAESCGEGTGRARELCPLPAGSLVGVC